MATGKRFYWIKLISIHALREEGDTLKPGRESAVKAFLSTPSARRATRVLSGAMPELLFLSTPSARRATPYRMAVWYFFSFLSTPSARRATQSLWAETPIYIFLSTPSARRATVDGFRLIIYNKIFLSTPSARRATYRRGRHGHPTHHFYPRPPRGGRPTVSSVLRCAWSISIHALREEGDLQAVEPLHELRGFLSTPSARRATIAALAAACTGVFLSTPSARRATSASALTIRP